MESYLLLVPIVTTIVGAVSVGTWVYFDADSRNAVYAEVIAVCVVVFFPAILVYGY